MRHRWRIQTGVAAVCLGVVIWRAVTAIRAAVDWFGAAKDPSARELYALNFQIDAVTVVVFFVLAVVAISWRPARLSPRFGGPHPGGYNFTENVRRSLAVARDQAAALGQERVDTGHILLGLIRIESSGALTILGNLHVDAGALRARAIEMAGPRPPRTGTMDLPFTPRAKKVLEMSMAEAREAGHTYVGTEHMLLGLLREHDGIAAQALFAAGVSVDAAHAELLKFVASKQT